MVCRVALCGQVLCYQGKGATRDPRAGGGACLALAGVVVACGAGAHAGGAFRKFLLDGGVPVAVNFQRYRVSPEIDDVVTCGCGCVL